jgi:hypothetical protein
MPEFYRLRVLEPARSTSCAFYRLESAPVPEFFGVPPSSNFDRWVRAKSRRCALARSHGVDHLRRLGPSAAQKARDETARARGDQHAVEQDIELSTRADRELGVDSGIGFHCGSETRRPITIASSLAVEDLDAHDEPSPNEGRERHRSARRDRSPAPR